MPGERSPYVGPRPFESDEQNLFFGRNREANELLALVVAHPAVLFYAQSGAGKTSLLKACLIPLLEREGFGVFPVARVSGALPQGVRPEAVPNLYIYNALIWMSPQDDSQPLLSMPLAAFLRGRPRSMDEAGEPRPRAIVFDQFEELFSSYPERWPQREAFFQQVAEALTQDPTLRVVFAIREEYLAQLDPYAGLLPGQLRARFRLERLRKEAALQAVTGPLRDTGRSFGAGVAEQLVEELLKSRVVTATGETAEVKGEFVEPVQLQVVCLTLWSHLPPEATVISQEHLQKFGDVNRALANFYEDAIQAAAHESGVKEASLRNWFEGTLITHMGTRGTAYREKEFTSGIANAAIDVLEHRHLIRAEQRAGARWYELIHDRFITPIQESNRAWRKRWEAQRRRIILLAWGSVTLILLVVMALARMGTTQMARLAAAVKATATINAEAYNLVTQGFAYAEQGDYQRAIEVYSEAIQRVPTDANAYFNRGRAYKELGRYDEAVADYSKAIYLGYEPLSHAYNNRGNVYRELGAYDSAVRDLSKAIELDPEPAAPYLNRGLAYTDLGDYTQAIQDYTEAIRRDRNYVKAYYGRGWAYSQVGDCEAAFQDFEAVSALVPDIPLDPEAAFPKFASSHNLGAPLTPEFDMSSQGKSYRVQGFTSGIVYVEVGDWGNIKSLRALQPAGIVMVYVPAGEFWMGSTDTDPQAIDVEKPQHTVYLDEYWIGRTEVTNAQFRKFIEAGGYSNREYWTEEGWQWKEEYKRTQPAFWNDKKWNQPDYPVVGVSWHEAAAYAQWAGARLPTEAEWEKAARGTDGRIWPWGNAWDGTRLNFCDKNCQSEWRDTTVDDGYAWTAPVGSYPAGASPYGTLDMASNVWEWVADWYEDKYYANSPAQNPVGPASGYERVLRGGSWYDSQRFARCAYRGRYFPVSWSFTLGFRVVGSLANPDF